MDIEIKNIEGKIVGSVQVRDDVFDVPMNPSLVHQVVVGQLANARQGTVSTKNRSRRSGGGRKPRPQKGTGAARAGTTRAPQWRKGGVAFGPLPRSFRHRTPRRMRRQAIVMTLSDKAREGGLIVLESLEIDRPKTRELVQILEALGADASILLVADGANPLVLRAAQNIPRLKMLPASLLNTVDVINRRSLIMTIDAVRKAEELWGVASDRRKRQPAAA